MMTPAVFANPPSSGWLIDAIAPACEPSPVKTHRRVAIITGAGRGVGRAVAFALAHAGTQVALLARSRAELEETARSIQDAGGTALSVPVDLSDPADLGAAVNRVRDWRGDPHILVNNAGSLGPLGSSSAILPAEFAATIMVNVIAAVTLTVTVLPAMLGRKWGRVVNVSSGAATHHTAMIGANAYTTSKAALEAHTLNLAAELAGSGVTVNAYRPGVVDTAMQAQLRGADSPLIRDRALQLHKDGSLLTPEASARALVARLASERTGQIWTTADPT